MAAEVYVLEGPDGCGKTYLANKMIEFFKSKGKNVTHVRTPGGTPIGEKLRDIVLDKKNKASPMAAAGLMSASRLDSITKLIEPAYARGDVIIIDRWCLSMFIYQSMQIKHDVETFNKEIQIDRLEQLRQLTTLKYMGAINIVISADDATLDARLKAGGRLGDTFKTKGNAYLLDVRKMYREVIDKPWEYSVSNLVHIDTTNDVTTYDTPPEWLLTKGHTKELLRHLAD